MAGYSEDLAYIHDVGFSDYAWSAGAGVLDIFRRSRIASGLVVDLGCGTGIWAARLLGDGYDVLGVDISASMIRRARATAPDARFVTASLLSFAIPQCEAVTSLGECLNYCFDPANGLKQMAALFRRVHNALRPGGLFVFDFAEPGQLPRGQMLRVHRLGPDWAVLVEMEEDRKHRTLTRKITSFRKSGSKYRRTDEEHVLRLYRSGDVVKLLESAGFLTRVMQRIGNYSLPTAHSIVVARKLRAS